ncbi:MAG: PQQ-binding-like beta-propeller repeat protein, partial [Planctomycetes bacterium]|nr:PQQ-binding-like beta-propeller repeat protein [Planctomycetota bacterium]
MNRKAASRGITRGRSAGRRATRSAKRAKRHRALSVEFLEPRHLLSTIPGSGAEDWYVAVSDTNETPAYGPLSGEPAARSWQMKNRDAGNTNRADFSVPAERLNDTFFDVFLWQKRTPNSPNEGNVSSTSMVFYDGAGPGGTDIVVGGYHWPKGVQGMDRHTGELIWYGNPDGGESIGRQTPAFSNDGGAIYLTNDATPHPLMAFESTVGPSIYWHNGDDSGAKDLIGSPTIAADGRVFLYRWGDRPYGATDWGDHITTTWEAEAPLDTGFSEPALYEDTGGLRVISPGRWGWIAAFDGDTGATVWSVDAGYGTDADATIDPDNGNIYVPLGGGDIAVAGLSKDGANLWGSTSTLVYDWVDGQNNPQRAQSAGALSHDRATYYFQTVSQEGDGALYAINTVDGSLKWSYETHSRGWESEVSSPIVTPNGV